MKAFFSKIGKRLKPYLCSHLPTKGRIILNGYDFYINEYFCIKCECYYRKAKKHLGKNKKCIIERKAG